MTPIAMFRAAAVRRHAIVNYGRWAHRHAVLARRHVPSPVPMTHAQAADIAERAARAEERSEP